MDYAWKIKSGSKVKLEALDPGWTAAVDEETARARLTGLGAELSELQALLYGAGTHSVLVVLQGMDTSGKDGLIRSVFGHFNPHGVRVQAFKKPSAEEAAHDFLWRIHAHTPARGQVAVFNRSHYEDATTVRVLKLAPGRVWRARFGHIRDFEEMLAENNTLIFKFFLHISAEEQLERLAAREQDVSKAWKLAVDDWSNRQLWGKYRKAWEEAIEETSTRHAPWHIIPADKKWYRNLAVAEVMIAGLRKHRREWVETLEEMGRQRKAELERYRQAQQPAPAPAPEGAAPEEGEED